MTLETFRKGIILLVSLNLPNAPDFDNEAVESFYYSCVEHLSDELFVNAVKKLARESEFFPVPAKMIKAAISDNLLAATEAWEVVQMEMDKCMGTTGIDPGKMTPAIWKVIETMGGLDSMWKCGRNPSFVRSEFINLYNQFAHSEKIITGGYVKELEGK